MRVKGIKRGQTIELLDRIENIADGEEIFIEVSAVISHPLANFSPQERQNRIKQVLGAWQNDSEIDAIFAEIDRDRHKERGRQLNSLDD